MTDKDQQLVRQLKQGRSSAVRAWFRRFHQPLLRFVLMKVSQVDDAEEIVQQTFINCLKHLSLFNEKSSVDTWMKSIARHEIADYYRKRYAKRAIQTLPLHELIIGEEDAKIADAHQVSVKVKSVLRKMRQDYRELLLLKYVDGKQVKTIAREWGRTFKSIEADLFRARADFKELYAIADRS